MKRLQPHQAARLLPTYPIDFARPSRHDTHLSVWVMVQHSLRQESEVHQYASKFCRYREQLWIPKADLPDAAHNYFDTTALRHNYRFWHGVEFKHEQWRIVSDIIEYDHIPTAQEVIDQIVQNLADLEKASAEMDAFERALGLDWQVDFKLVPTKY